MNQNIQPTISGLQVGERNGALVNTSTLAWTYTADDGVKEKHNGEDSLDHFTFFNDQRSIQKYKLMKNKKTKQKRFNYTIVWNPNGEKDNCNKKCGDK